MTAASSSSFGRESGSLAAARIIDAVDLARLPEHRHLWHGGAEGDDTPQSLRGLPPGGVASPLGFWLYQVSEATPAPVGVYRITVGNGGGDVADSLPNLASRQSKRNGRPTQTVSIKAANLKEGDLRLTISAEEAFVSVNPAVWDALSEPVLLVVTQSWRFQLVERELDRLIELIRGDLRHSTMPSCKTLLDEQRLIANDLAVRSLMVDLPQFEGLLSDPYRHCTTERGGQIYGLLAQKFGFEGWCERIDEKAEIAEGYAESITEKLFHFKNFAWEIALEALIVAILCIDVGLYVRDAWKGEGFPDKAVEVGILPADAAERVSP